MTEREREVIRKVLLEKWWGWDAQRLIWRLEREKDVRCENALFGPLRIAGKLVCGKRPLHAQLVELVWDENERGSPRQRGWVPPWPERKPPRPRRRHDDY